MFKIKLLIILVISGFAFQSCLKDRESEKKAEELRILEQYISLNGIIADSISKSGLYYIEDVTGTGEKPKSTDWIEFTYTTRLVSNPISIVMTTDSLTAQENSIYNANTLYGPKRVLMSTLLLIGLYEGLTQMKEGGKATLIFPSSIGYGRYTAGNIPAYSSLIFEVELLHVIPNIARYERTLMTNYLIANNIIDDSTSTGLFYHEILPGTGDFPVTGKSVTMVYKGTFLNGKIFTQSDAGTTFVIGYNQIIPGVEEGIKMMKKGGKAQLIIPYYLAYGENGYVYQDYTDVYTLIWPYTTLVYEIELINIQFYP